MSNLKNKEEKIEKERKQNLSDLWDNIKQYNLCVTGVPGREEREQERRNIK